MLKELVGFTRILLHIWIANIKYSLTGKGNHLFDEDDVEHLMDSINLHIADPYEEEIHVYANTEDTLNIEVVDLADCNYFLLVYIFHQYLGCLHHQTL